MFKRSTSLLVMGVAFMVLFFALVGTSFAASGQNQASISKHKKIRRGPRGKPGPAGPKGDTGPQGPKGETGGLDLSHATRVVFVPSSGDSPITAETTPFATATITAPARGILVAQTSLYLFSDTQASCPCVVQTQLKLDAGSPVLVADSNLGTTATDYVGGFDRRPTGGAEAFVVNPGTHTIVAQSFVQQDVALTGLGTSAETLQVFYIPFNGAGATP